jgi:ring-1,2-phenylacetyl-CoA epoxidase subunit PaaC
MDINNYLLHLADSCLILSQRQSEWCGHGPVLEQDIAITNISLDLLGQARNFYQYAASLLNNGDENGAVTEDTLAYLRTEREYKNFILCETVNGDWAQTVLRLYFFSEYQYLLLSNLVNSADTQIAAIAQKSLKETTYHLRWSKEWVIRLGDGTEESKQRLQQAFDNIWKYTREFFDLADYELEAAHNKIGYNANNFKETWLQNVKNTLEEATLTTNITLAEGWTGLSGKTGTHTEQMGFILTELQYMQRAYPNSQW